MSVVAPTVGDKGSFYRCTMKHTGYVYFPMYHIEKARRFDKDGLPTLVHGWPVVSCVRGGYVIDSVWPSVDQANERQRSLYAALLEEDKQNEDDTATEKKVVNSNETDSLLFPEDSRTDDEP